MKGILLDENFESRVIDGEMVVGDSMTQEVALIIGSNKGEWKEYPTLGPGLTSMMRGTRLTQTEIEQIVDAHLKKDNKSVADVGKYIKATIK